MSETEVKTVKLMIQSNLADAVQATCAPGESLQNRITDILCEHFGIERIIRFRGNPSGKAKGAK